MDSWGSYSSSSIAKRCGLTVLPEHQDHGEVGDTYPLTRSHQELRYSVQNLRCEVLEKVAKHIFTF